MSGVKALWLRRIHWNQGRKAFKKEKRQVVTIPGFCAYMKIEEERVRDFIQ